MTIWHLYLTYTASITNWNKLSYLTYKLSTTFSNYKKSKLKEINQSLCMYLENALCYDICSYGVFN